MKNFVQSSLAFFLMLGFCAAATENITFSDIPAGHWAADPVYRAVNQLKIIKGYPDGTFRGNESVSRYDTVVYLNNLSLTMETMLDQRLNMLGAPTGSISSMSFLELRRELDDLRAEVRAMQGRDASDFSLPGFLKDALSFDVYTRSYRVHPDFYFFPPRDAFVPRVNFRLGREFGLNGYRFEFYEDHAGIEGWAGRYLTPDIWLKIKASIGPGQRISRLDDRVSEHPDNVLGLVLSLWGLELGVDHTYVGDVEVDYLADQPGILWEDREVNKTTGTAKYKIPIALPILNTVTLEYALDNYYTVPDKYYRQDLRTIRNTAGVRFEPHDLFSIQAKSISEEQYFYEQENPPIGELEDKERSAQYYDVVLELGDIFNSGTSLKAMYAQKDAYFGRNNLNEDLGGVNLMGYASCQYLRDKGLIYFTSTISEAGIQIKQNLFHPDFFIEGIYIYGEADPDKDVVPDEDLYYAYEQYAVILNWQVQKNGILYLAYEQTNLFDNSVDRDKDQFYEVINKVGVKFTF